MQSHNLPKFQAAIDGILSRGTTQGAHGKPGSIEDAFRKFSGRGDGWTWKALGNAILSTLPGKVSREDSKLLSDAFQAQCRADFRIGGKEWDTFDPASPVNRTRIGAIMLRLLERSGRYQEAYLALGEFLFPDDVSDEPHQD